ncbi:MAG: glycosyltransferase family 2 protein [Lachnospiraceae bacterium]|nr:glycosyltransferase family 2 protein [Lachnospiraceae bacterium]
MKNLAICIPTYNRSDILKDTFSYELDTCKELGIDIYLYDSSTDGKTVQMVRELQGYDNLHHITIDSSVTLDEKVVMIFQSFEREKKHDYLWLVGDSISFGPELLKKIMELIQSEPTMVFVNNEDIQKLGNKEYDKASDIFQELFWRSTLWGSMIVQEALYYDINWTPYIEKFVGTDQISVGLQWYRLAQVEDFRAVLLSVRKGIDVRKSSLKKFAWWKEKECGSETVYRVWAQGLIDTVYNLPFSEKEIEAALETQRIYVKNFYWLNLCRSRKDGVYNKEIYRKYRKGIRVLSKYPYSLLYLISVSPIFLMKIIVKLADQFKL